MFAGVCVCVCVCLRVCVPACVLDIFDSAVNMTLHDTL